MDQNIMRLRIETVRGDLEGVRSVLNQGVSVDQPFKKGEWNALMHASSLGHHHIVKFLLEENADPNFHKELFTPLMAACASNVDNEEKLLKCVEHLTLYDANVNAMERHRLTPLMFACKQGHAQIVTQLVTNNADLNAQDSQGWTALFWAVTKGKLRIVEILLNAGANKDERDRSGGTALLLATRKGFHQIAEILRYGIIKHIHDPNISWNSSEEDDSSCLSNDITRSFGEKCYVQRNELNCESASKGGSFNNEECSKFVQKYSMVRRDTLELINELQRKPWKTDNSESDALTYVTAVKIVAEFASQISSIHATMAFIRYRFQHFPLEPPHDSRWAKSSQLRSITSLAYCKSEQLFMETKYLNEYLTKLDDAEIFPSEVIVEKKMTQSAIYARSSVLTTVIVASACIFVMLWNNKSIHWTWPMLTS